VFKGIGDVGLVDCHMNEYKWSFEGPAATTINFMKGLYHGLGEEGKKLIEYTFENIRQSSNVPKGAKPK
jgi:hypothetical protein